MITISKSYNDLKTMQSTSVASLAVCQALNEAGVPLIHKTALLGVKRGRLTLSTEANVCIMQWVDAHEFAALGTYKGKWIDKKRKELSNGFVMLETIMEGDDEL